MAGRFFRGFSLIELMVVMAAIGLLLSIAAPRYVDQVDRSREAVLQHNLRGMREAIDRFHADKSRYPKNVQELIDQRYLRELPLDPMTDRVDSWVLVPPVGPQKDSGIFDVRSGAPGIGRNGVPYAKW